MSRKKKKNYGTGYNPAARTEGDAFSGQKTGGPYAGAAGGVSDNGTAASDNRTSGLDNGMTGSDNRNRAGGNRAGHSGSRNGRNGRTMNAMGYGEAGASRTRRALRGFNAVSGSPQDDIDMHNMTLRQRSRMLKMAAPLGASAINTNRTKAVGTGLSLKASINRTLLQMEPETAKTWEKTTELEFRLWAGKKQNCDALGINNFDAIQQLAFLSWMMSGDVFVLIKRYEPTVLNPYSLRLHVIEADRISTPVFGTSAGLRVTDGVVPAGKPGAGNRIHDGVEVDENGMIAAYYICDRYPNQISYDGKTTWTRVEAYSKATGLPNILHIMESERPDQYRGVPYLAGVIEPLLQLRRYTESELMAALIQSFFTAWIETENPQSEYPFNEVGDGDVIGEGEGFSSGGISESENEHEMGPGTVNVLRPGEKVVFGNPNIPTSGFETFTKTLAKIIGAGIEVPYDVLVKEFNSSYSASRGALLEMWEGIKMRRKWFVDDFCQAVYEIWLTEAVARGRIKAPGFFENPITREAWSGARWIGPVQGQLDPKKEAEAALSLAAAGVKTYEQITRELGGGDFEENAEQLKHEKKLLRDAGITEMQAGDFTKGTEPEDGEEGET